MSRSCTCAHVHRLRVVGWFCFIFVGGDTLLAILLFIDGDTKLSNDAIYRNAYAVLTKCMDYMWYENVSPQAIKDERNREKKTVSMRWRKINLFFYLQREVNSNTFKLVKLKFLNFFFWFFVVVWFERMDEAIWISSLAGRGAHAFIRLATLLSKLKSKPPEWTS